MTKYWHSMCLHVWMCVQASKFPVTGTAFMIHYYPTCEYTLPEVDTSALMFDSIRVTFQAAGLMSTCHFDYEIG